MNTLFIRLEGPLQSWGTRARWDQRDTALEPTKSGIVGLLACALGWGRGRDEDIRALGRALRLGVRVDRKGTVLRDYQTVVGGVRSAEGKIKVNAKTREPETVQSDRYYLCDASFLAAVQGPDDRIAELAAALQNPVWPLFLGRRSCPASEPFFAGTGQFDSLEAALTAYPVAEAGPATVRAVLEVDAGRGTMRRDEIDELSLRTYLPRYTQDVTVTAPGRGGA